MENSNVKFGFYNALYKNSQYDRLYESGQMSKLFDGLILDGIYLSSKENDTKNKQFMVSPFSEMKVIVAPGKAWFNGIFIISDENFVLEVGTASQSYDRIDAIVLETNTNRTTYNPSPAAPIERYSSIKIVSGTPASSPEKPTMVHTNGIDQYPIAYIHVTKKSTVIRSYNIEYVVGIETPYFAWLCERLSISELYSKWEPTLGKITLPFIAWFNSMTRMLGRGSSDYTNIKAEISLINSDDYIEGLLPKVDEELASFSGDSSKITFTINPGTGNEISSIADIFVDGEIVHSYVFDSDTNSVTLKTAPSTGTNNVKIYYVLKKQDENYTVYFS